MLRDDRLHEMPMPLRYAGVSSREEPSTDATVRSLTMKWLHSRPICRGAPSGAARTGRHADSGPFRRTWGSKDRPATAEALAALGVKVGLCAGPAHTFRQASSLSISARETARVKDPGNGDRTGPGRLVRDALRGSCSLCREHPCLDQSRLVRGGRGVVRCGAGRTMNFTLAFRSARPAAAGTLQGVLCRGQASPTGVGERSFLAFFGYYDGLARRLREKTCTPGFVSYLSHPDRAQPYAGENGAAPPAVRAFATIRTAVGGGPLDVGEAACAPGRKPTHAWQRGFRDARRSTPRTAFSSLATNTTAPARPAVRPDTGCGTRG